MLYLCTLTTVKKLLTALYNTLSQSALTFLGSVGQSEGRAVLSVQPQYPYRVGREVHVHTHIHEDFPLPVLSCEHLQYRCSIPSEQHTLRDASKQHFFFLGSVNSLFQAQLIFSLNVRKTLTGVSKEGKFAICFLSGHERKHFEILQMHKPLVGVSGKVNRRSDCLLIREHFRLLFFL